MRTKICALVAAHVISASPSWAQAIPDSLHHENDCRSAIQVITTGHPVPDKAWAYSMVRSCGSAGGAAVAQAMRIHRFATDTLLLQVVTGPTRELRDRAIFDAAYDVARDNSASVEARVYALRTLIWLVDPGRASLGYGYLRGADCIGGGVTTHVRLETGEAVPGDYVERVNELGRSLQENRDEPRAVRSAAICAQLVGLDVDSVRRRNNCRLAAQVIESGEPAPRTEWAWYYIGYCDPDQRARTYRVAIDRVRNTTDPIVAQRAILRATYFRDGTLFEDVLEIAGDPSASIPARVAAFMALAVIRNPSAVPRYEDFLGGLDEYGAPRGSCSGRSAHQTGYIQGPVPLPADYLHRIESLRRRIRLDGGSEPPDVRSASECA